MASLTCPVICTWRWNNYYKYLKELKCSYVKGIEPWISGFWILKPFYDFLSFLSRATAFGILTGICKVGAILGNSIFASFVGITKVVPILLASSALVGGGLLALRLPDTRDQVLMWAAWGWNTTPVNGEETCLEENRNVYQYFSANTSYFVGKGGEEETFYWRKVKSLILRTIV